MFVLCVGFYKVNIDAGMDFRFKIDDFSFESVQAYFVNLKSQI